MEISTDLQDKQAAIHVKGSLNTNTSPELEAEVERVLAEAGSIVFDFSGLDYISSSGLRVVLGAYKRASAAGGSVRVTGTSDEVREVFMITGFNSVIDVA